MANDVQSPIIYLISGLGIDHRVFERLSFPFSFKHISWTDHKKSDTLEEYASTLLPQIDQSKPIILIGLSFGGFIAQEIAKLVPTEKVILISSLNGHKQMPKLYRVLGFFQLQYLLPGKFLQNNPFTYALFGIKNKKSKAVLKRILEDTSLSFLKWATIQCLKWRSPKMENGIQIHGSEDRIIPVKNVQADVVIPGGSHFMIGDKYKIIQESINSLIR